MSKLVDVRLEEVVFSPFQLVRFEWLVITAGDQSSFNSMTACWGSFGHLWDEFHICTIYVRPTRHTFGFLERHMRFSVQVFSERYKEQVLFLGRHSGRDVNKVEKIGLTPNFEYEDCMYYEEADLVFFCDKLYSQDIKPELFSNHRARSWYQSNYPEHGHHRMYVGGIFRAMQRQRSEEEL